LLVYISLCCLGDRLSKKQKAKTGEARFCLIVQLLPCFALSLYKESKLLLSYSFNLLVLFKEPHAAAGMKGRTRRDFTLVK
jgi:hypothetical protein